jgi:hypothetical protein
MTWDRVGFEGGGPLGPVLGVAPSVAVRLDVGLGAVCKGLLRGLECLAGAAGLAALLDRINAHAKVRTGRPGFFSGAGQRHLGESAQAHLAALAVDGQAGDPGAGAGVTDTQVKAVNPADGVHAGRDQLGNRQS